MNPGCWVALAILAVVCAYLVGALLRTRSLLAASQQRALLPTNESQPGTTDERLGLQRVIDALPVAAIIVDASGIVRVSNAAGEHLLAPRIESAFVGRAVRGLGGGNGGAPGETYRGTDRTTT